MKKQCRYCLNLFEPTYVLMQYCSNACKKKSHAKQRQNRAVKAYKDNDMQEMKIYKAYCQAIEAYDNHL